MPNVWTHIIFGQEALRAAGRTEWLEREADKKLFHWGCQGPDPLFYYRFFLPWSKDKRMYILGELMHEEHCGPFLMELLRRAGARGGQRLKPYAAGFLLHHILDRNAHPYIFAKSGFKAWNHQRLEIILDTLVAGKLRGIHTWKEPVWRELALKKDSSVLLEVSSQLSGLAAQFYPEASAGVDIRQWEESFRDMLAALKLFHDPSGVKRVLTAGKISPFVYKRTNLPLDYCNEARNSWGDPAEEGVVHHTGFWDHWEEALAEAEKLLPLAMDFMEDADPTGTERLPESSGGISTEAAAGTGNGAAAPEGELLRLLGNHSYSTGRDCGEWSIRYEDPLPF